jgi:hypothetical protein
MRILPPGNFRLLGPNGEVIMSGAHATCMELIPGSKARSELLANLRQMRADAAAASALQARAQASAVRAFCDSVIQLQHRLDTFERKLDARKRKEAKERKAREAKAIADRLASLPDADDAASYGDPLTTHGPSHPFDKEQLHAINMGTSKDDADDDNQGDLPEDLTRSVPPTSGKYAYPCLDDPPRQVSQPIAVSLNSEVQP